MARGWESKSVEDQMAAAEEAKRVRSEPALDASEQATHARRTELQMSRARAQQDLQGACDRRYRALLERTLEHIDAELRALDAP